LTPYLIFVFLSWTSDPLSNLLLRLNRYGRLLLTKEEIAASNLVGSLLLTAVASATIAALTWKTPAIIAAAGCAMLTIPVAGSFNIEKPRPSKAMFIYTIVMGGGAGPGDRDFAVRVGVVRGSSGFFHDRLFPVRLDRERDQPTELKSGLISDYTFNWNCSKVSASKAACCNFIFPGEATR
jgi:hypothetical protein